MLEHTCASLPLGVYFSNFTYREFTSGEYTSGDLPLRRLTLECTFGKISREKSISGVSL